jgi:hypothetical protein
MHVIMYSSYVGYFFWGGSYLIDDKHKYDCETCSVGVESPFVSWNWVTKTKDYSSSICSIKAHDSSVPLVLWEIQPSFPQQ